MLIWEFYFVKHLDGNQQIMFHRNYKNGELIEGKVSSGKETFVNYVSLFPTKDIVRIKLGVSGQKLYSFYYFDKTFFDLGFLGVLGVSEYNETQPFDWSDSEIIAKFIFAEYFKLLRQGKLNSLTEANNYLDWIDSQVAEYYLDFLYAKEEYYEELTQASKKNLQSAFLVEADLETSAEIDFEKYTRKIEIQLISAIGTPLTKVLTFINGKFKMWWNNDDETVQNLQGMSYSVLQSFVEQQDIKLNLQTIKVRKPEEEGFEFILFKNFSINNQTYLVIANLENYDHEKKISIDQLLGYEDELLESLTSKIKEHSDWFKELGQVSSKQVLDNLERLIIDECTAFFE